MNRFSPSFSLPLLSLLCLLSSLSLAATGCTSTTGAPSGNPSSEGNNLTGSGSGQASSACADRACGVDCTPAGSDEPFNCNAAGMCVATGQDLHCKAPVCPEFLGDCGAGTTSADLDGDGCVDGCAPFVRVAGHVLFPKGWAPPVGAAVETTVDLVDTTLADASSSRVARTIVTANGDASREFLLQVTAPIVANHTYVVHAHVDTDADHAVSKSDLVTTESYPVLTNGHGDTVDVTVHPVL